MLKRQTTGSVVCSNCGRLVGVNDEQCMSCGKRNPSLWGFGPALDKLVRDLGFHEFVLYACGLIYLATLLYAPDKINMGGTLFSILEPDGYALLRFGMSGYASVFEYGRWWTVLSAGWLHGGLLHILLNVLWIRQLAPVVAEYFGASRLIMIYTLSCVFGFGVTSVVGGMMLPPPFNGAAFTVGASAPLFGLFGALYQYGRRTGSSVAQRYLQFLIIWVVIGVLASFGSRGVVRVDNWAHLGGFVGGMLAARWLDPMLPEKPWHTITALVCVVLSFASIALSFFAWPVL